MMSGSGTAIASSDNLAPQCTTASGSKSLSSTSTITPLVKTSQRSPASCAAWANARHTNILRWLWTTRSRAIATATPLIRSNRPTGCCSAQARYSSRVMRETGCVSRSDAIGHR
ncbi:MAG: hypothetical protein QOD93_4897 [Acetobacteraceae bacterium]|jgi:hypothetical protein|nr:hypothetical protein [Acetobacteraceae bacterium]MEA2771935.1 hypothetical protein [Acetobacteraceae bacterium]